MTIEKSDTSLTVTFRRRRAEKWITIVVALVAVEAIYIGLRINAFPQQTELYCDRSKDVCSVSGHDGFEGTWTYSFAASSMQRSRIVNDKYGDPKWVVDRAARPIQELGAPTGRKTQQEQYAKYSVALQSFIDDPAQRSFEARFDSIGGPSGVGWALLILFFAFVLLRFIHGWRARLIFDRAAGQVTIECTPALIPPVRRRFPLASVLAARGSKGGMSLLFAFFPTITFRLIGRGDRVLFKRRMMADKKREVEIHDDIKAVNDLLLSSKSAA